MPAANTMLYNDPAGGTPSGIGSQIRTDFFKRRALIEVVKEQYFQPLADVAAMPKHYGKKIKQYLYIPLLDDRNVNDMGIDAAGATIADGNLYGSSKDIGTITGKLPVLGEEGGRVNRVGFTRVEIEGEISKMGFFTDYTKDSLQFDSDSELEMHVHREMLRGASEITEDVLQMDLLAGAGVIRYAGAATSNATVSGETGAECVVDYEDLMRLAIDLDQNRTPKQTKIIAGSKMTDTKVVAGGRYIYCGSEMIPTFERMKDLHNNPAFVSVEHYAAAGNIRHGEIGKVGQFRIIVVPEMHHWAGVGAAVTSNAGYRETGSNYDVFPLLVVGEGSFTTIGFQTSGKSFKFEIYHKKPGREMADLTNPFGEKGFMSIKWWYGTMILRSERLAVLKAVAEI